MRPELKLLKAILYEIEQVFVNLLFIFWELRSCRFQRYLTRKQKCCKRGAKAGFKFAIFFKKCVFSKYLFSHEEMITWQRMKKIGNYRIYAYSKFQQNRIIFGRVTALLILVPKKEKTVFFSFKQKYWIFRMKFSYNMWNLLFKMLSLNFSQIIAKTNHLEQIQNLTFFWQFGTFLWFKQTHSFIFWHC